MTRQNRNCVINALHSHAQLAQLSGQRVHFGYGGFTLTGEDCDGFVHAAFIAPQARGVESVLRQVRKLRPQICDATQLTVSLHLEPAGRQPAYTCVKGISGYCFAKLKKYPMAIFKNWAIQFIENIQAGILSQYDVDRYWLPLYLMFFDGTIEKMPYSEDIDQSPFIILKERGVTFFDAEHPDFGARMQGHFKAMFGTPVISPA